jgi:hypothetical protein
MSAVADIFDRDGDGYIDYYEFVAALHPNKDAYKPVTDADKIEDEVLGFSHCLWPQACALPRVKRSPRKPFSLLSFE